MASMIAKLWTKLCAKKIPLSIMIIGLDNSGKTSILRSLTSLSLDGGNSNQISPSKTNSDSLSSSAANTMTTIFPPTTGTKADRTSGDNSLSGNIMPTAGYNYERIQYKNLTITALDFSGQNRYRNLWQEFYNSVDGIVFVIDSSDLIRLVVVRDELETMLCNPYFQSLSDHTMKSTTSTEAIQKQLTISQGKLIQSPLESHHLSSTSKINSDSNNNNLSTTFRRVEQNLRRRTKIPILFMANKTDLASSVDTEVISKALNLSQLPLERHPWFIQATSVKLDQGIMGGFDWLANQLSAN